MKEIKFRAWNGKEMIPMMFNAGVSSGSSFWYPWGFDVGKGSVIPEVYLQFTGLKDKNGKEIYEGDILQHTRENGKKIIKGFVKYLHGGFKVSRKELNTTWPLWGYAKNCEIIGNIYENPELAKKTADAPAESRLALMV